MNIKKLFGLCAIILAVTVIAWAQGSAGVQGQVLDQTDAAIPGATVTVTNTTSGTSTGTTTDAQGRFKVSGLSAGRYVVTVKAFHFQTFRQQVAPQTGQQAAVQAKLMIRTAAQTVNVSASAVPGATLQPSHEQILKSSQTIRVLGRKEMDGVGPLAGTSQIISMAPGANVVSYGGTGQQKATIALSGII